MPFWSFRREIAMALLRLSLVGQLVKTWTMRCILGLPHTKQMVKGLIWPSGAERKFRSKLDHPRFRLLPFLQPLLLPSVIRSLRGNLSIKIRGHLRYAWPICNFPFILQIQMSRASFMFLNKLEKDFSNEQTSFIHLTQFRDRYYLSPAIFYQKQTATTR